MPEHYWVNFLTERGEGAAEVGMSLPITRGEDVLNMADLLRKQSGSTRHPIIRNFIHLRSEPDEEG